MNTLIAVHGLVLYLALAWKAYHLTRAPRDQPLRWVTACLACAALAYPAGIAADARPTCPAAPWLFFAEFTGLVGTGFTLTCFFVFSLQPAPIAHAQVRLRAVPFAAVIAILVISAALTLPGTRMNDLTNPVVAAPYLTFDIYISCLLADAWLLARRGIRDATATLACGLRIASAGLAMMVAGASLLAVDVIFIWTRGNSSSQLGPAGNLLVIPGILVFITGVCYPGAVMRVHALRLWGRHLGVYRELGPLWTLLHQAFPQDALARVPARPWRDLFSPRRVHWRYYRRIVECRDGLVRISPRLAHHDNTSPRQLASQLLAALQSLPATPLIPSQAAPIAVPATPDLDADAGELVRLSRELAAAQTRIQLGSPVERTTTA